MTRHGKKYVDATRKYDPEKLYSVEEAFELVKQFPTRSFDETVEVAWRLGIDPARPTR